MSGGTCRSGLPEPRRARRGRREPRGADGARRSSCSRAPSFPARRENRGFSAAANEALVAVEGASHLLLCHDDVAPAPDAVRRMVEEAYRSNAGIVGPKLVEWDAPDRLLQVGLGVDRFGAAGRAGRARRARPGPARRGSGGLRRAGRMHAGACGPVPGARRIRPGDGPVRRGRGPVLAGPGRRGASRRRALGSGSPRSRLPSRGLRQVGDVAGTAPPPPAAGRAQELRLAPALARRGPSSARRLGRRGAGRRCSGATGTAPSGPGAAWRWNLRHRRSLRAARKALGSVRQQPDRVVARLFVRSGRRLVAQG